MVTSSGAVKGHAAAPRSGSLKNDAIWTALEVAISGGLAFIFRLVVARFLDPEALGIAAIALAVYAVVQVVSDFGMSATLIQRPADQFNRTLVDTAFAASCAVAVGLFFASLLIISPVSAMTFHEDLVGWLIVGISVTFLMTPTISIQRAVMFRERRYREVTICRCLAALLGLGISTVYLFVFRDIWTLVVNIVATQFLFAVFLSIASRHRLRPRLDRQEFKRMFSYSGLILLSDTVVALAKNLDIVVIGNMLAATQLGLYSTALYITDVTRLNLMSVLNRVMFTKYSTIQNDKAFIAAYYVRSLQWNCLVIFPVMSALIIWGPALTSAFLGEAWTPMGPTLQILAFSVMINAAGGTTSTVYKAMGKPGQDLALFLFTSVVILIPALLIGVHYGGIEGAAVAIALKKFIAVVIRQFFLNRLIGNVSIRVVKALAIAIAAQIPLFLGSMLYELPFVPQDGIGAAMICALLMGGYFAVLGLVFMRTGRK